MILFIQILSIAIFVITTFFGSKHFYYLYLRTFSNKALAKLDLQLADLNFSFEEITYLIALPSNNPVIATASREDLHFKKESLSLLYPTIEGIKIFVKNIERGDQMIAYLSTDNFRLPLLEKSLYTNEISEEVYHKICSYKLIHPSTLNEILDEVYLQIRSNRYTD